MTVASCEGSLASSAAASSSPPSEPASSFSSIDPSAPASATSPASGIEAHVPVDVMHVLPGQSLSTRHAAHVCTVVLHSPLRQSPGIAQGPSPLARPHEVSTRSHTPDRQRSELPHDSEFEPPHLPSMSQSPDRHCTPAEHAVFSGSCPFVPAGTQVWALVSQNDPTAQSVLAAHAVTHVPVASQMPLRHAAAVAQGAPARAPQELSVAQTWLVHWAAFVQPIPLATPGAHVPALQ
jgi:hypothetical protein